MNIVSFFLIFLFLTFLFYFIYKNKNNIISYQTIKKINQKNFDLNSLNKIYKRDGCNDYCSSQKCNNYEIDLYNYKKCLECQKKFKCYNSFTGNCETCMSFGIGQCKTPINPKYNLCK